MVYARRLELALHPNPPAGLEVHSAGIRHEVQQDETLFGIAHDYSQAFHMYISADGLARANSAAVRDGLQLGELLTVPGLTERTDAFIRAGHPAMSTVGGTLRHTVAAGETLFSIAAKYAENDDLDLTWRQLYKANAATIGADPSRIVPGQRLNIPGISTAGPQQTNRTLGELDGEIIVSRTTHALNRSGTAYDAFETAGFVADSSRALKYESLNDALGAAKFVASYSGDRTPVSVVQTKTGAYAVLPLDRVTYDRDSAPNERLRAPALRGDAPELIATVQAGPRRGSDAAHPWNSVSVRRYDQ